MREILGAVIVLLGFVLGGCSVGKEERGGLEVGTFSF